MTKEGNLETFHKLIINQFAYGGQKYASTNEKEATDILFDIHGYKWLIGTCDKYCFRFKNLQRERDLLKIATYMYIIWLKKGFHLSTRFNGIVNTTVEIKTKNFNMFCGYFESYITENEYLTTMEVHDIIQLIHEQFSIWSLESWDYISEEHIYELYNLTYIIWNRLYAEKAGQDQDVYNETKSTN